MNDKLIMFPFLGRQLPLISGSAVWLAQATVDQVCNARLEDVENTNKPVGHYRLRQIHLVVRDKDDKVVAICTTQRAVRGLMWDLQNPNCTSLKQCEEQQRLFQLYQDGQTKPPAPQVILSLTWDKQREQYYAHKGVCYIVIDEADHPRTIRGAQHLCRLGEPLREQPRVMPARIICPLVDCQAEIARLKAEIRAGNS